MLAGAWAEVKQVSMGSMKTAIPKTTVSMAEECMVWRIKRLKFCWDFLKEPPLGSVYQNSPSTAQIFGNMGYYAYSRVEEGDEMAVLRDICFF